MEKNGEEQGGRKEGEELEEAGEYIRRRSGRTTTRRTRRKSGRRLKKLRKVAFCYYCQMRRQDKEEYILVVMLVVEALEDEEEEEEYSIPADIYVNEFQRRNRCHSWCCFGGRRSQERIIGAPLGVRREGCRQGWACGKDLRSSGPAALMHGPSHFPDA